MVGSDHNLLLIKKASLPDAAQPSIETQLKIFENKNINDHFKDWNNDVFSHIDYVCTHYKSCLLGAASKSMGYKKVSSKRV